MESLKKIVVFTFISLFLVSSMSFTINKKVCLKSGKTEISFTNIKNCCKKGDKERALLKANCCDINNTSFTLDDYDFVQQDVITANDLNATAYLTHSFIALSNSEADKYTFSDLPPPLYGRTLLTFISVLTI